MFEERKITDINLEDYPLSEEFFIGLEDTQSFGKQLYFGDSNGWFRTSFSWWDYADNTIRRMKEKAIPLGSLNDPYIDLEQNWQV